MKIAIAGKLSDGNVIEGVIEAPDAHSAITAVHKGLAKGLSLTEVSATVAPEIGELKIRTPRKVKATSGAAPTT